MKRLTHLLLVLLASWGSLDLQAQCTASFSYSISGTTVTFSSTSTNTGTQTMYSWYFSWPTNNYTVTGVPTASFTYPSAGVYTVVLNISSIVPTCSSSVVQTITISGPCQLTFTSTPTSGTLCNGTAGLLSNSVMCGGAMTYTWLPGFFTTATASNLCAGTYTVFATSSGSGTNCCSTASGTITVPTGTVPCTLAAAGTYSQGANGTVNFINLSTGTTASSSYTWNFGSSATISPAPAHSYSANGVYNVTLVASNNSTPACTSSTVLTVTVTTIPSNTCNASFVYTVSPSGMVTFSSTSAASSTIVTYQWNFGPATYSAAFTNTAAHSYTNTGSYTVILFINTSSACTASFATVVNVPSVTPCGVNAGFTYSLNNNGLVTFTNVTSGSTPGTTYTWSFGDGHTTTASLTASNVYTANGTYTTTLVANNGTCSSMYADSVHITSNCPLNASFAYTITGNQVYFASTSTGTQTGYYYSWSFGNGNTLSTTQSTAMQTYSAGQYPVWLTVSSTSAGAGCTRGYSDTVQVVACALTAGLSHTVGINGIVSFSGLPSGTVSSHFWNFGDGTISYQQNPVHTYLNGGTHYVMYAVASGICTDTIYQAINITGISCNANSGFTLVPTNVPKYWNAIPSYPWNVSSAAWDWGDGSSSGTLYASHQYSAAGNYQICLSVTVSCASSSSTCATYSVFRGSPASEIIYVNVAPPATNVESIGELLQMPSLNLYPNPTDGVFSFGIENAQGRIELTVTDITGHVICTTSAEKYEGPLTADLSDHPAGIYFIRVRSGSGVSAGKIVLEKR